MKNYLFLMSEAGDGGQGGGAGGGSGGDAAAGASSAATSALGGAADPAATDPNAWLPEKFRVNGTDGALDLEASARKQAEAYGHAEKRLATGDVPPATADEYDVKSDKFDFAEFKKDPDSQAFLKAAHAKGMTNAQLDFVLSDFHSRSTELVQGAAALDAKTCVDTLQAEWGDQTQANLGKAADVALRLGATREELDSFGNNPAVCRMLLKLHGEMAEGLPPRGGVSGKEDRETLMKSEAYLNSKHADHARVYAQVQALYK